MVRLVVKDRKAEIEFLRNFNSSMVRLVVFIEVSEDDVEKFQFQYGAIGRGCCLLWMGSLCIFQFQYGAIGRPFAKKEYKLPEISIPVWCDW